MSAPCSRTTFLGLSFHCGPEGDCDYSPERFKTLGDLYIESGRYEAFALRPAVVPEPLAIAEGLAGLVVLGAWGARRMRVSC